MKAEPIGERKEKIAPMKMVPRRPTKSLTGSEIQPALGMQCQRKDAESNRIDLQERNGNVWARINEADKPLIGFTIAFGLADRTRVGDSECIRERQIGAIGTCLIPTLDGRCNRVEDNGKIEDFGMSPAVGNFFAEYLAFALVQLGDMFNGMRTLGYQSALAKQWHDVGKLVLGGIVLNILKQRFARDADQRVSDSADKVSGRGGGRLLVFRIDSLSRSVGSQLSDTGPSLGLIGE